MQIVRKHVDSPLFVIVGDDPYYLHDVFSESDSLVISNNSLEVDFALMTLCSASIISASSFALCGAFYSLSKHTICIAPAYWFGHRQRKWIPRGLVLDWITYL
jgi:hypothetical protein